MAASAISASQPNLQIRRRSLPCACGWRWKQLTIQQEKELLFGRKAVNRLNKFGVMEMGDTEAAAPQFCGYCPCRQEVNERGQLSF